MAVTLIHSFFLAASPIAPKTNPEMKRAKYGRPAKIPACDNLKPSTFYETVIRYTYISNTHKITE